MPGRELIKLPRARFVALISLLLLGLPDAAHAQATVGGFDLERLSLNPSAEGTLLLASARVLEKGEVQGLVSVQYQRNPLLVSRYGESIGAYVSNRFSTQVSAGYGLIDRLEVGLSLSLVAYQGGDDLRAQGVTPVAPAGVGTPVLYARYLILKQDTLPFSLMGDLGLGIPLGSQRALAVDRTFSLRPKVVASSNLMEGKLLASAELGVQFRALTQFEGAQLGHLAEFNVGAQFDFGVARAEGAIRSLFPFAGQPPAVELLVGGRKELPWVKGLDAFVITGPGLGQTAGTPAFRVLAGVSYGRAVGTLPFL